MSGSNAIDLKAVRRDLLGTLLREGGRFGLTPPLRADYVTNPGGFVNTSFTVSGGATRCHVKLATDGREISDWWPVREILTERYRAPEVLGRIELADHGLTGVVFPHLPGSPPGPDCPRAFLAEVLDLAGRLHADRELYDGLPGPREETALGCYLNGVFECLSEDLRAIVADPEVCSWISPRDLAFLSAEVDRLEETGRELLPDEPCRTPIHGDLWLQNILISGDRWHLVDWDGLAAGDPAADYSWFLYAPWARGREVLDLLPDEPGIRRRVEFRLRAASFDMIVDPLADCTEVPDGLDDPDAMRAGKREVHAVALERYRRLYA
jgi:hypothetical protein